MFCLAFELLVGKMKRHSQATSSHTCPANMFEDFPTLQTLEDRRPGPLRGPDLATSAGLSLDEWT